MIEQLTDTIIERLKSEGFIIQRYNAYSTNSVYLKLDYGVCNSIRISDHKGKKGLDYRYNLLTNLNHSNSGYTKEGLIRHYYAAHDTERMIERILNDRAAKMRRYGKERYLQYMKNNSRDKKNEAGFWRESWVV